MSAGKPNASADLVVRGAKVYLCRPSGEPILNEAIKAVHFSHDSKIEFVDGDIHLSNIKLFFKIPDNAVEAEE